MPIADADADMQMLKVGWGKERGPGMLLQGGWPELLKWSHWWGDFIELNQDPHVDAVEEADDEEGADDVAKECGRAGLGFRGRAASGRCWHPKALQGRRPTHPTLGLERFWSRLLYEPDQYF